MILPAKPLFDRFGTLHTWIVGIQYYDGRSRLRAPEEVFFDREPDNPFDPHAVAVFTKDGTQVGHLPRYDARHFAPLIDEGAIALVGRVTGPEKGGRIPVQLDVHATSKLSPILAHDPADDWRAIYHNLLVSLWSRIGDYSAETLGAFRDRMRDLAHTADLYPKTEFLYRMMKAAIESRARAEQDACKQIALNAVRAIQFGAPRGWPELTVYPFDVATATLEAPPPSSGTMEIAVVDAGEEQSHLISAIAARCAYPADAKGLLVLTRNHFHALNWFSDPACAKVVWFPTILDALDHARGDEFAKPPAGPEDIRAALVEKLERAEYVRADGGTATAFSVRFYGEGYYGFAEVRDQQVIHLEYRIQPPVYSPAPRPQSPPR